MKLLLIGPIEFMSMESRSGDREVNDVHKQNISGDVLPDSLIKLAINAWTVHTDGTIPQYCIQRILKP